VLSGFAFDTTSLWLWQCRSPIAFTYLAAWMLTALASLLVTGSTGSTGHASP
jgi:hypothetical protein